VAVAVYVLCAVTATACAVLLARAWRDSRVPLLFWSALCFAGLAINNILLFVDKVVVTGTDLSPARSISALVAVSVLVFGLVWETR
jgi:hypothetical protein